MMSFTPTTYSSTASNAPSSAAWSPSPPRLIFNACGFGVVASGDRARGATAGLMGDSGPQVEPSCITSSSSSAPGGLSSSRGASRVLAAGASSGGWGVSGAGSVRRCRRRRQLGTRRRRTRSRLSRGGRGRFRVSCRPCGSRRHRCLRCRLLLLLLPQLALEALDPVEAKPAVPLRPFGRSRCRGGRSIRARHACERSAATSDTPTSS